MLKLLLRRLLLIIYFWAFNCNIWINYVIQQKGPYFGSFCFERLKMTLAVLNSYVKEVNKKENIANKVNENYQEMV